MSNYEVIVGAGTLQGAAVEAVRFPHHWTPEGVTAEADFTGGHLLHLAVAGCVLNDTYREARRLGVAVDGVRVTASGELEPGTWHSTGIRYTLEVDSPAPADEVAQLLDTVDAVAEIPKAIRAGAPVTREPRT